MKREHLAFNIEIGKKIRERRQAIGMTLDDLISLFDGMSRSSLSAIENGKQSIHAWELHIIELLMGRLDQELDPEIIKKGKKLHLENKIEKIQSEVNKML